MFKTRLLSGILLVAAALLTIISGGVILWTVLFCISVIGAGELYRAMGVHKDSFGLMEAAGYLGILLYYGAVALDFGRYGMMAVIFSLILLLFVYVFSYPKYDAGQTSAAFFGILYVAVMLSFIYLTRNLEGGQFIVWLIFICSWGCDTCAYCVGMLIGKHKMAPVLSPKKSVEGAVGGVAGDGASGRRVRGSYQGTGGGIRADLRCGRADLHGGRSGCFRSQEESGHQRLREADPRTRRDPGPL